MNRVRFIAFRISVDARRWERFPSQLSSSRDKRERFKLRYSLSFGTNYEIYARNKKKGKCRLIPVFTRIFASQFFPVSCFYSSIVLRKKQKTRNIPKNMHAFFFSLFQRIRGTVARRRAPGQRPKERTNQQNEKNEKARETRAYFDKHSTAHNSEIF